MELMKTRGCVKLTRGDWIGRRRGKNGEVKTSMRKPSEREREANRKREKNRRRVANNIFSGLRTSGEFSLPKHPDRNDILIALCHQAGYHVAEDGTISRQRLSVESSGLRANLEMNSSSYNLPMPRPMPMPMPMPRIEEEEEELSLELTLSFRYM